MADSTIDSELFILLANRFPGRTERDVPTGDFTDAKYHNVEVPQYEVGITIEAYCDGSVGQPGWTQLTYLQIGTQNADVAITVRTMCVPDSATVWYEFTNDPDGAISVEGCALGVYAISAMTDDYYGFFWTGGVCPEQYITAMGDNYLTDADLVAGNIVVRDLTADAIGLGKAVTLETHIGYAIADDAA